MSPKKLLFKTKQVISTIQSYSTEDINICTIVRQLKIIREYLEIRLRLTPRLTYIDIIENDEFQHYISVLFIRDGFMSYYNQKFDKRNADLVSDYQSIIGEISSDISNL